ncbi:MAG: low molecular weight phosphotyrosine protein phosphatase [Ruminococcus sp.]|nr:low molecular weight phosphotyrosine protein phosphatase [Ruminococcus sp.]
MVRIMFVCHGNICRSPMAEFILKDMVQCRGIAEQFEIASSATSTEEIWGDVGNPVYPPAQRELAAHGIFCGDKRAVQLKKDDYMRYDYFLCMDQNNLRNARRILGADRENKVHLLLSFADGGSIADPWYCGNFDRTYDDIVRGCEAFLVYLGMG